MKNVVLISLFFFGISQISAQETISIGQKFTLNSLILGEVREIEVQLPKNYNNSKYHAASYPVIYVLDGDWNFQFVAALERFDTKFLYRPHPEMIVVGIKNTDRTRDFTPTKSEIKAENEALRFPTSGGADNFMAFLENEVIPFVNSEFRTNGYNILHGHSFGGLFALYTLLKKPDLFQSYIAIDPSLWWDDKVVYNQAARTWQSIDFKERGLFVALAYEAPENANDLLKHGQTIRNFCENILNATPENNLRGFWKYYPDYDHGTVPVSATLDALKLLFDGIQLPVKEIPKSPELIHEHYQALSEQLKFNFIPEESLLYDLISYVKGTGKLESAKTILGYALTLYPHSTQLKQLNSEL